MKLTIISNTTFSIVIVNHCRCHFRCQFQWYCHCDCHYPRSLSAWEYMPGWTQLLPMSMHGWIQRDQLWSKCQWVCLWAVPKWGDLSRWEWGKWIVLEIGDLRCEHFCSFYHSRIKCIQWTPTTIVVPAWLVLSCWVGLLNPVQFVFLWPCTYFSKGLFWGSLLQMGRVPSFNKSGAVR